jgi:hypothetical protein
MIKQRVTVWFYHSRQLWSEDTPEMWVVLWNVNSNSLSPHTATNFNLFFHRFLYISLVIIIIIWCELRSLIFHFDKKPWITYALCLFQKPVFSRKMLDIIEMKSIRKIGLTLTSLSYYYYGPNVTWNYCAILFFVTIFMHQLNEKKVDIWSIKINYSCAQKIPKKYTFQLYNSPFSLVVEPLMKMLNHILWPI